MVSRENTFLYPNDGEHRIREMFDETLSIETRANVCRWYTELIIKEFLADYFLDEKYKKESLLYLISNLKTKVDKELIDALELIKDFCDRCSHYNPNSNIKLSDFTSVFNKVINVYNLILVDLLKKKELLGCSHRATIISTLFPEDRIFILERLMSFSSDINKDMLHKWCLACVKAGKRSKYINKLQSLKKRNIITPEDYNLFIERMNKITNAMNKEHLPIAKNRNDVARNFIDVYNTVLNDKERKENDDLIKVISRMVKDIPESGMGKYIAMHIV